MMATSAMETQSQSEESSLRWSSILDTTTCTAGKSSLFSFGGPERERGQFLRSLLIIGAWVVQTLLSGK
jgi:hypothetical protein